MTAVPTPLSPLPLAQVQSLARAVALQEAHRPDDVDDLTQIALWAYHKAEQRYRRKRIAVTQPVAFARTVCQRAIWYHYARTARPDWALRTATSLDVLDRALPTATGFLRLDVWDNERGLLYEDATEVPIAGLDGQQCAPGTQLDFLELNEYFEKLERACGTTARRLVENLVAPRDREVLTVLRRLPTRSHRSRHVLRIRAALGLRHTPKYYALVRQIKTFTRSYVQVSQRRASGT